jgi:hypothetical protein
VKPFISYYGAKWRAATLYPRPEHDVVVEPFAGSAGYSVRWNARRVMLFDLDENIVAVWRYLIAVSASEIMSLPLLRVGESVDDLPACEEAKKLVGFWCNAGASQPMKTLSAWARKSRHVGGDGGYTTGGGMLCWGEAVKRRLASQVDSIREWTIEQASYRTSPDIEATWFIDPPYQDAGKHYRHRDVDFGDLASFCSERRGLVVACEAAGAEWLPFKPLSSIKATHGRGRVGRSAEVAWINREAA